MQSTNNNIWRDAATHDPTIAIAENYLRRMLEDAEDPDAAMFEFSEQIMREFGYDRAHPALTIEDADENQAGLLEGWVRDDPYDHSAT